MDFSKKWITRFLELAANVASWSKDPSTKVGAVAVNDAKAIVETGFNGLPRGVTDTPERMKRPAKYIWTAHAEENLVAHAARAKLEGTTVYVTHFCCAPCTRMLINAGVKKVVVGPGLTSMPQEQFAAARVMFAEADVEVAFG
jgi:dCMP deaminase